VAFAAASALVLFPQTHGAFVGGNWIERATVQTATPGHALYRQYAERRVAWLLRMIARFLNFYRRFCCLPSNSVACFCVLLGELVLKEFENE
jgi:hypothetical protein